MWVIPLLPEQASRFAGQVDGLMLYVLCVAVFFSLLIAGCIIYFSVTYRHSSKADRANPSSFNLPLEIAWTGIPLALTLSMFVWGARLFIRMREPPPDAMDVYVVGKQWMWKIEHPGGQREINELHVPVGRPVRLLMTSQDVIHSFFVPYFRMKQDVLPGRYTSQWFEATKPGRYHIFCSQYCGTSHSAMIGWVTAMPPVDFERWLAGGTSPSSLASMPAAGSELFNKFGCATCHQAEDQGDGPSLAGLFGARVKFDTGSSLVADENYIRESILRPRSKIVKGYKPQMPTFQGQLNDEQMQQLIAYIKSLKKEAS